MNIAGEWKIDRWIVGRSRLKLRTLLINPAAIPLPHKAKP